MLGPNLVLLFAADVDKTADFYEHLFDWKRTSYRPENGIHFLTGTIDVLIMPEGAFRSGTTGAQRGWGVSLCFQVPDLDAMYEAVQEADVDIVLERTDSGFADTFTFADYDKHRITLYAESDN